MVIEFTILFKVAYPATQSIDSPMVVILLKGSLFNKNHISVLGFSTTIERCKVHFLNV